MLTKKQKAMTNEENKYVTPEYLLSHGFMQYKSVEEGDVWEIPFQNEDDLHFREIEFDRRMFVVIFSKNYDDEKYPNHYHHSIYVQEDAGCGFVCIPEAWWELPIEYFEAIYYGIRGEKPKFNPIAFQDADYEIIEPKQLPSTNKTDKP